MTRFKGGAADGVSLDLARSPLFLRVVRSAEGQWDALDQLDDEPAAGESISVYRRLGTPSVVHIDYTDARGRRCGKWMQMVTYAVVEPQPDEEMLRQAQQWQQWATARYQESRVTKS